MSTYVVLVNERPESRAALDWALKTVEAFPGTAGQQAARHPRALDRYSGRPPLRVTVAERRRHQATQGQRPDA